MHHTYISSTLLSVGTHHGSIPFSSNDCSSNLFCERFGRIPFALSSPSSYSHSSQCCSCCADCCSCCASPSLPKSSFAVKPSFLLYGLRQSSLIHCPPSRRMNLRARAWCYNRVPGYGFDLGDYEVPCSFEESSGRERIEGRKKEARPRQVNSQRRRCFDSANDAEAVINLLSEEVSQEYLNHSRRTGEFSERLQKARKGSYGGGECESQRKKNLRLRSLASKSTCEFESNANEFKKEESRMKEERNEKKRVSREVYKGENNKGRTGSASLSSYYSLSSEEEFESAKEVHEEPSTGNMNLLGESSSEGKVTRAVENHPDGSEKQKEVSEHRTRTESSIEWDLRKKSEKKLTDFEETEYVKHSSQFQSRTENTHEDNHTKSMNSGTKIGDFSYEYKVSGDKEESAVVVSQEKRANDKVEKQAEVRRNSHQVTDRQAIHETDSGTASRYHRLLSGGEGMVGRRGKDRSSSSRQEFVKITEMGNAGLETVSTFQKQSESRTKTQEERKALSSFWEFSDKRDQIGTTKVMGEVESTKSSQKSPQMSEGHQRYRGKTSSQHSESEAEGQRLHRTDQKPLERVQSRKGPKDAINLAVNLTNVSLVNASSNTKTVLNSQRNSQQIIVDQEGDNTSTASPIQETGGRHPQLVREPEGVRKTSILHKRISERASSPHTSEEEAVERIRSEAVMVPPSHQLVARSSFREDPAGGVQVQYVSEGEMSVPEIHQEPQYGDLEEGELNDHSLYLHNPGDVLGSARRQEESSIQYVGEFVERARHHHEVGSETEVSKGNNSRRSSAGSGEKGPSDEIWDVTDPSVHEPPKAEAPEELIGTNEAGSSVVNEPSAVRKTGKSMWAIIGDIVRLRWSSPRAETSKSTGGKTSSNDSAASEAWFSGRDPDEKSEGTLKRETSSSDHVLPSHTSSRRRGEASDTGETKRMASPSLILKSGSTSRGFGSPAGEKELDFGPDEKRSQVAPSVGVGETPSISLPLSARSSPIVEPSLGIHKSDASASGSGEKDGEVKRRKLQRNKQVIRDRFDDWEEAYIRESEQRKIDEMFMIEALIEAKKAADIWEVPVGAVLVQHGKIIARGYNLVEELRDSTAHAEMICIREGSNQLRSWRLAETTLYVTLEPCTMCAGAILQARIDTLVWGAPNKLLGADGSWIRIFPNGEEGNGLETDKPAPPVHPFHPKMTIRRGVLAAECADVMQSFFQLRRKKKVNNSKGEQQQHSPQNSLVRVSNHPSKILKKMHDIFHVMFCL